MTKAFRAYSIDQRLLLPPDMREWLPDGDLALFISDVVDELDLRPIYAAYEARDERGQPPYHPAMMVKLLLYGYCVGLPSSRKLERATYRDVAFRVLAGDNTRTMTALRRSASGIWRRWRDCSSKGCGCARRPGW